MNNISTIKIHLYKYIRNIQEITAIRKYIFRCYVEKIKLNDAFELEKHKVVLIFLTVILVKFSENLIRNRLTSN